MRVMIEIESEQEGTVCWKASVLNAKEINAGGNGRRYRENNKPLRGKLR